MLNGRNLSLPIFLLIAATAVVACKQTDPASENSAAQSQDGEDPSVIAARTAGTISSQSPIRVQFVDAQIQTSQAGESAPEGIFTFEPAIEGLAVWESTRELQFRPKKPLPQGQTYKATVDLKKATGEDEEQLSLAFQVMFQAYEIAIEGVMAAPGNDFANQIVKGTIRTADVANGREVESVLQAQHADDSLTTTWDHASEREHHFTVAGISRQAADSTMTLSLDGQSIGVDRKTSRNLSVPGLNSFSVTNVRAMTEGGRHVEVRFSDPLKLRQNLKGLIRAGKKKLRFTIDGSVVRIYSNQAWLANETIEISTNIQNTGNFRLKNASSHAVSFSFHKPAVRFTGKGVILPSGSNFTLPIEARGLESVQVEAMRVNNKQMTQYLQVNTLTGTRQMDRVGRTIWKKTIKLDSQAPTGDKGWARYGLDIKPLMNQDTQGLYRIKLSFKRKHISYPCEASGDDEEDDDDSLQTTNQEEETSFWDNFGDQGMGWSDYYQNRQNPCHPGYYRGYHDHRVEQYRNVLVSDLGLIAKLGQDSTLTVVATDINTNAPKTGVDIVAMDYQQNVISQGSTNAAGIVQLEVERRPYFVVAKEGKDHNYLRLDDGQSLSTSHFDTSGQRLQKGIKGFIYGERGVWRPGDKIYLTFVLFDSATQLPKNHPVHFQLTNSRGQVIERTTRQNGVGGFYSIATETERDAPTGNYTATFFVGGTQFTKVLKIETVIPNRLKIELENNEELVKSPDLQLDATLASQWLHGAPAKNLSVDISAMLSPTTTRFAKLSDYNFDDPSRRYKSSREEIYQGTLDAKGNLNVKADLPVAGKPSGMLKANLLTRVYEPSGAFSQSSQSVKVSPYEHYVGLRVPKGDKSRGMLLTDMDHPIEVVRVDNDGNPTGSGQVDMHLYKIGWRWWWQQGSESLADFVSSNRYRSIQKGTVTLANGKATWNFKVDYPEWGRYLVTAVDKSGQHRSAKIVYIDWPGWAGKQRKDNPGGASVLSLSADKTEYKVGEDVTLTMPASPGARMFVSIESGSRVLRSEWVEADSDRMQYKLEATPDMAPTAYAHVMLVQPHKNTLNDAPIRMYGITPLKVVDSNTKLEPVIVAPESFEPNSTGKLSVSEKTGKAMTYTLAVVDEGLLGLTNYKTPAPWKTFYTREALGVKTWDSFDDIVGAFGGKLNNLLSIGGSDDEDDGGDKKTANRFVPMVRFLGPFTLAAGEIRDHSIDIPQYVGAVRAMVVAGDTQTGAFGSAHQEIFVRKPLMVLATLPRVLGPGEAVKLPISVFAMTENIKNVVLQVKTEGPLKVTGKAQQSLTFESPGDSIVTFPITVSNDTGIGVVEVIATGHGETARQRIEIDVMHRNVAVNRIFAAVIEPGTTWNETLKLPGMVGANDATLELSHLPPLNLEERLKYLVRYPHGCVEQTTSSVFPQLFLSNLVDLDDEQKQKIQKNITAGISRLKSFQNSNGGLGYWPGGSSNAWGTSYAGHFLLEAKAQGYALPPGMIEQWVNFQSNQAQAWAGNTSRGDQLNQAYRLYGLALAKSPDLSAMNRLKEQTNLQLQARWRLAAAYHLAGQQQVARTLVDGQSMESGQYSGHGTTYGSALRDLALILDTLALIGDRERAMELVQAVSKQLSSNRWHSTQTTAYSLLGISRFVGKLDQDAPLEATYTLGKDKALNVATTRPIASVKLAVGKMTQPNLKVQNPGTNPIYVRVATRGVPKPIKETPESNSMALKVDYTDTKGRKLDISSLPQGEDFNVRITVTNRSVLGTVKDLALSQVMPSGWEIHNERLISGPSARRNFDYQDIRDDRIYTYFDLRRGESRSFTFKLNSSYLGRFYMPQVSVEAMYDGSIYARDLGNWVEVRKAGPEG